MLFCLLCLVVAGIVLPFSVRAEMENAILTMTLNGENKGELTVGMTDSGDFLLKIEDLKSMGIVSPRGEGVDFDGNSCLSLKSVKGITFSYDERAGSLNIEASPDLLARRTIDYGSTREHKIRSGEASGFLNYALSYGRSDPSREQSASVSAQTGFRARDYLFQSDFIYEDNLCKKGFARLMSNLTYDRQKPMERIVIGDSYASSGILGSTVNMGGISYSKNYEMNPDFLRQPAFDYSGFVKSPSEVSILVDGTRIKTDRLSPGTFDLKNLLASTGPRDLEIVIRDMYGREEALTYSYYFTDALLRKGLHEFTYNLGLLRKGFGVESDGYGKPVLVASHRYGLTNSITAGYRMEATPDLLNGGGRLTYGFRGLGVSDISAAISSVRNGKDGFALSLNHVYTGRVFSGRVAVSAYSKFYSTIADCPWREMSRYEVSGGIGYGTPKLGSLSLDFANIAKYSGETKRAAGVSYSRNLTKTVSVSFGARRSIDGGARNQVAFGITWSPGKDTTVSSYYQGETKNQAGIVQVQKNPPSSEGFSYRASVEAKARSGSVSETVNPYVQYNGRYGIYAAEYRGSSERGQPDGHDIRLSASGAVVYAGGSAVLSRPVYDSFATVKVAELPNIAVYHNNQEIGKTDSAGRVVVPGLNSYAENEIRINDKDIPVNYTFDRVSAKVFPLPRSGSQVRFDATKTQAFTGKLAIRSAGTAKPVEFRRVKLNVEGKEIVLDTGRDGELYFENIAPGTYHADLDYQGKRSGFAIAVPSSDEVVVDLGEVIVEDIP
jgi:outer membrane usher protein